MALLETPTKAPVPRNWDGPYLRKLADLKDPWGNDYYYLSPGKHNKYSYDLASFANDGQADGGHGGGVRR